MNMKTIRNWDKSQFLDVLGLRERESTSAMVLRAIGLIGVGAVIGVGVGLLAAPSPGRDLRVDLSRRLKNGTDKVVGRAKEKLEEAQLAGA